MTNPKDFFKRQTPEEFFGPRISPKDFFSGNDKYQPLNLGINLDQDTDDPDQEQPIQQTQNLRDRHTYITGISGVGKTTLLLNMIYQDLKAGNGIGIIATELEMIEKQILPFIPKNRIDDVIYFNPDDSTNPILFNPLKLEEGQRAHLKATEVFTIFERVIGDIGGQRMREILRQTFSAMVQIPHTTLLDIPRLLDRENPHYRQQIISQLDDEYNRDYWRTRYPQENKTAHLPILNRLGELTHDPILRNVLCQSGKSLNFREVMDTGKIVIFNLSDGILGEQNSQLLGQLIVSQFQLAVMSRANLDPAKRRPFYLYLDEFQTFVSTSSTSYEKLLSRARKYRLGLILAHQYTEQIKHLLKGIFGTVSTIISFAVSPDDARRLGAAFGGLPAESFTSQNDYEAMVKLGKQQYKMKTRLPAERPNFKIAEQVIERSRELYGARGQVEQETSKKKKSKQPGDDFFDADPDSVL